MIPELKLHNSLTRRLETFTPLKPGEVGIYLCGLTVYDHWHLGHALQTLVFDSLRRYLEERRGLKVTFVNNYTDIDDKIIKKANAEGLDPKTGFNEISDRYIQSFVEDLAPLNVKLDTIRPRVTAHIPEILAFIEKLIARGHAYEADDGVYFEVTTLEGYGELSGQKLEDQRSGSKKPVRGGLRNPMDFALWKKAGDDEPGWDGPWGRGRPGWHIECSAMATRYLGDTFDIHLGGLDLVFPHHENEKAQSEGATGKGSFARIWLHNGLLKLKGEKMSKSLGNTMRTRLLLEKFGADAIRHFVLSSHYRSPAEYEEKLMEDSVKAVTRLRRLEKRIDEFLAKGAVGCDPGPAALVAGLLSARQDFDAALADDFNTPRAFAAIFGLAGDVNRILNELEGRSASSDLARLFGEVKTFLFGSMRMLGFKLDPLEADLDTSVKDALVEKLQKLHESLLPGESVPSGNLDQVVEAFIDRRVRARAEKDYALGDTIRKKLGQLGVQLTDTKTGTTFTVEAR